MALERPRRRELTELVADHRVGDEDRDVLAPVVHGDGVTDHGRNDHGSPGPGLDDVLGALLVLGVHLLEQVVVHERALLQAARHAELLLALLAGLATADDELVAGLGGRAGAAFLLAPWADRVPAAGGLALAAAERVVDRVHGHSADGRALALPPHPAGLAPADVRLLGIADLADRRPAPDVDIADLTRGHPQLGVRTLLGHQLHARAGRSRDLGSAAGTQLDRVHHGADRDVAQRQAVARLDVGTRPVLDPIALLEQGRREDVALLAVRVVQQGDARGPVRVVLDLRDLGRNAVLVVPAEVDQSVRALVPAALVTAGHPAVVVAATPVVQRAYQRLLRLGPRDLHEVGHAGASAARRRRLVFADTHLESCLLPRCPIP